MMTVPKNLTLLFVCSGFLSCNSLPKSEFKPHKFPSEEAFIGAVKRASQSMGMVRAKVDYPTLDGDHEEGELCQNAFNKAVSDMVKMAKGKGADAIVNVKSVVFYEGGQHENYPSPECSDDGMEGQVLTEATAVKWK